MAVPGVRDRAPHDRRGAAEIADMPAMTVPPEGGQQLLALERVEQLPGTAAQWLMDQQHDTGGLLERAQVAGGPGGGVRVELVPIAHLLRGVKRGRVERDEMVASPAEGVAGWAAKPPIQPLAIVRGIDGDVLACQGRMLVIPDGVSQRRGQRGRLLQVQIEQSPGTGQPLAQDVDDQIAGVDHEAHRDGQGVDMFDVLAVLGDGLGTQMHVRALHEVERLGLWLALQAEIHRDVPRRLDERPPRPARPGILRIDHKNRRRHLEAIKPILAALVRAHQLCAIADQAVGNPRLLGTGLAVAVRVEIDASLNGAALRRGHAEKARRQPDGQPEAKPAVQRSPPRMHILQARYRRKCEMLCGSNGSHRRILAVDRSHYSLDSECYGLGQKEVERTWKAGVRRQTVG